MAIQVKNEMIEIKKWAVPAQRRAIEREAEKDAAKANNVMYNNNSDDDNPT
jgi:hypothetical protein